MMNPDIHFNLFSNEQNGAVAEAVVTFPPESETGALTVRALILRDFDADNQHAYRVVGQSGIELGPKLTRDILGAFELRGVTVRRIVGVSLKRTAADETEAFTALASQLTAASRELTNVLDKWGLRLSIAGISEPYEVHDPRTDSWRKSRTQP